MSKQKTVMVGMSGGVDSTVTALLLQQQGYEVAGVTFRLWEPEDERDIPESGCCSIDDVRDAKMACDAIGVPHYVFNYKDMFKSKVVDPFVFEYSQGRTPNPCIACNQEIKFSSFLKRAIGMGYDYIATGHYAIVEHSEEDDSYRLKKAVSLEKDQSYVLYGLTGEQLKHVLMPLGTYSKNEVRQIAEKHGFKSANKPDSQDICFIPDGDYGSFIKEFGIDNAPGEFIDINGNIIGSHKGIYHFTIGQRKGLGVSFGKPMFVKEIIKEKNQVVLSDEENLYLNDFVVSDVSWVNKIDIDKPFESLVKIRYGAEPELALIEPQEEVCKVSFKKPVRAITKGQAAVFYDSDYVLGGGTITKIL